MVVRTELQLPNGTKAIVEGTEEEVIRVAAALQVTSQAPMRLTQEDTKKPNKITPSRGGPTTHITELAHDDFFSQPRSLGDVKTGLAERGHPYPVESLSGPIVTVVQQKLIRRYKEGGTWKYINR